MGNALLRRLKQAKPFEDAGEEALVNVVVAAAWVSERFGRSLEAHGLSHPQYNV